MSVKYSLALMGTKPGDKTAPKKYYAKAQSAGALSIDNICTAVSHSGTIVRGDVLAVSDGLIHEMVQGLRDGKVVELGDFGHFQIQVSSTGAETEKEFTVTNIKSASIQFRPGRMLTDMLKALQYQRVAPRLKKAAEEEETIDPGS